MEQAYNESDLFDLRVAVQDHAPGPRSLCILTGNSDLNIHVQPPFPRVEDARSDLGCKLGCGLIVPPLSPAFSELTDLPRLSSCLPS